ncbi:hypothetical protein [Streptomyces sp. NPDC000961]|uniref:hypothetical protein n=1 Tax=Streptomyces sp. NPDC000961 TaxID=3364541 RepID=UPI0036C9F5C2
MIFAISNEKFVLLALSALAGYAYFKKYSRRPANGVASQGDPSAAVALGTALFMTLVLAFGLGNEFAPSTPSVPSPQPVSSEFRP